MVKNFFRDLENPGLAYPGKLCALENFGNIGVPLQLITFFLTRSQVAAHKAEACLVQRHAYWNATLHQFRLFDRKIKCILVKKKSITSFPKHWKCTAFWPCCQGIPWCLSLRRRFLDDRHAEQDHSWPTLTRKFPPSACWIWGDNSTGPAEMKLPVILHPNLSQQSQLDPWSGPSTDAFHGIRQLRSCSSLGGSQLPLCNSYWGPSGMASGRRGDRCTIWSPSGWAALACGVRRSFPCFHGSEACWVLGWRGRATSRRARCLQWRVHFLRLKGLSPETWGTCTRLARGNRQNVIPLEACMVWCYDSFQQS